MAAVATAVETVAAARAEVKVEEVRVEGTVAAYHTT